MIGATCFTAPWMIRFMILVMLVLSFWRFLVHLGNDRCISRDCLMAPAQYTFDIWWAIYAFHALFVVREWFYSRDESSERLLLYILFAVGHICNIVWFELAGVGKCTTAVAPLCILWLLLLLVYGMLSRNIQPFVLTSLLSTDKTFLWPQVRSGDWLFVLTPFTIWFVWVTAELLILIEGRLQESGTSGVYFTLFWIGLWFFGCMGVLLTSGDLILVLIGVWFTWGIAYDHRMHLPQNSERAVIEGAAFTGVVALIALTIFLAIHKAWRGPKLSDVALLHPEAGQPVYRVLE